VWDRNNISLKAFTICNSYGNIEYKVGIKLNLYNYVAIALFLSDESLITACDPMTLLNTQVPDFLYKEIYQLFLLI